MSRIGKLPVKVEDKVNVEIKEKTTLIIKGAKSTQKVAMLGNYIEAEVKDGFVVLTRKNDDAQSRALHGLYRSLVQNAMTGVSTGWTKSLTLNGVGYRANVAGKNLELTLGFSHPIKFPIPEGIEITVDKQTAVLIKGADKSLVGQVAAKIRDFRPPEPYLGKGVRYTDEVVRKKAGKSGGK